MHRERILLVARDAALRTLLRDVLVHAGHEVDCVETVRCARLALVSDPPALVLLDLDTTAGRAPAIVSGLNGVPRDTEVVLLAGPAQVDEAIAAVRHGAYDFVSKPIVRAECVRLAAQRALERRTLTHGSAVGPAPLEQELRSAVMRLSSLIEAGRAMGDCRSLNELLSFFLGLVCRELEVDRASLMLLAEELGELEIVASRGLEEIDTHEIRIPVGEGVAGKVARTGQPLLVTDVQSDPRVEGRPRPDLSASFISAPVVLSIPIKSREKVLGVINVTNRHTGRTFDEGDLDYLSGMAGQLAVAVERARSYEELEEACASLRATQDKLVFSERLKVIGQMAAGIAHELNNTLSVILTRAQRAAETLRGETPDLDGARSDLDAVRDICLHGADSIRRIQDYTRIRKDAPDEPVALHEVARKALAGTRIAAAGSDEESLEVCLDLHPVAPVPGNRDELIDAASALLANAMDAMAGRGRLTLRTREEPDLVVLEIVDDGPGMSDSVRERLFEPFFSTRAAGRGLGASIAFGIVRRHNGNLIARSRTGKGSTLRLELPRVAAPLPQRSEDTRTDPSRATEEEIVPVPVPEAGSLRILLVDDDDPVRETYEDVLGCSGHEVVAVPDAVRALGVLKQSPCDVVITDLTMPGMSGLELAGEVKRRHPDTAVVLFSGWAVQQSRRDMLEAGIDHVLSKPCLLEELLDVLRNVTRCGGRRPLSTVEP